MRTLKLRFLGAVALCLAMPLALPGCRGSLPHTRYAVEELRQASLTETNVVALERWFAAELLEPKGRPDQADKARRRIEQLGGPKTASGELIFALDDHFHGRLKAAPNRYLKAAEKARLATNDPQAELIGWTAVHYALDLKRNDPNLFAHWKDWLKAAVENPLALGWRARGELADYWLSESEREQPKPALGAQSRLEHAADVFGCVKNLRVAGPFGHGAGRDLQRRFAAEEPGPWPQRFSAEAGIERNPRVLKTERNGCLVESTEPLGDGIYYVETYLVLPEPRDLIISVQGARNVFIDDVEVLDRDTRTFGIWPKFGVRVRLLAGRHRVLAKTNSPRTSIRIVDPKGTPAGVTTTTDAAPGYGPAVPQLGDEPNVVSRYVKDKTLSIPTDPVLRFALASLAEQEGQSDLASLVIEPCVLNLETATGPALLLAARFTEQDPLYAESQTRDLIRGLHEKSVGHDPNLWEPALSLLLFKAEQSGAKEVIADLEALARKHPEVPGIIGSLVRLYRQLGWSAEYQSSVERMLAAFPKDPDALDNAIGLFDARGRWGEANALAKQMVELDPDSEVELRRALSREDYPKALEELRKLAGRRPERKDLADRISDVLERSGNLSSAFERLAAVLKKTPKDPGARHSVADHDFARGRRDALRQSIVDGIESGANTDTLQDALDLVEGRTELEPFRLDSKAIIQAFEKSGRQLPGTAARVLDYAATWVHADGSSRMLEHEVVRIQSEEAIRDFSEYQPPQGLLLRLRVIKADGRTLEPLSVPSKQTVTFPHLEVGDYVETEVIVRYAGDGQNGRVYLGPTWFFREEKLAYDRSELLVITPETRPVIIESRAGAPTPLIEKRDGLLIHRFRVDASPAAPSEPYRPSARETMPNVRLGWGADPALRLREFLDATAILTPMDPRIVRVAKRIVEGVKGGDIERAKRLYHYVMDNIEEGEELDGRQIIMGRRGNLWRGFVELCRALEIPYRFGVARNSLQPPSAGPFDAMNEYGELFLRIGDEKSLVDLTVGEKFTPFGYLSAEIRGAKGFLLDQDPPRPVTLTQGSTVDKFDTKIEGRLSADGSATLTVIQTLTGKPAIMLRNIVAQAPSTQLKAFVESRLIAPAIQGARLLDFEFRGQDLSDQDLIMRNRVEVPRFAEKVSRGLSLQIPYSPRIGALGALASRETPMVLDDSSDQTLTVELQLPKGAKLPGLVGSRKFEHGGRWVTLNDRVVGDKLILERHTVIPAGRVPVSEYDKFAEFAREAGGALSGALRIDLAN